MDSKHFSTCIDHVIYQNLRNEEVEVLPQQSFSDLSAIRIK